MEGRARIEPLELTPRLPPLLLWEWRLGKSYWDGTLVFGEKGGLEVI